MTSVSDFEPAGLVRRGLALFADLLVFCAFFFPATRIYKGTWMMYASDHDWQWGDVVFDPICLVFLIIIILYYVIFESWVGHTPGKWICGIKVISRLHPDKKPGFKAGLIRNLARMIDGLPAMNLTGIIMIVMTPDGTRLGDVWGKTIVVKRLRK